VATSPGNGRHCAVLRVLPPLPMGLRCEQRTFHRHKLKKLLEKAVCRSLGPLRFRVAIRPTLSFADFRLYFRALFSKIFSCCRLVSARGKCQRLFEVAAAASHSALPSSDLQPPARSVPASFCAESSCVNVPISGPETRKSSGRLRPLALPAACLMPGAGSPAVIPRFPAA
jgi:hypothetical protein